MIDRRQKEINKRAIDLDYNRNVFFQLPAWVTLENILMVVVLAGAGSHKFFPLN